MIQKKEGTEGKSSYGFLYVFVLIVFTSVIGYVSLGKGFDFDSFTSMSGDGYFALHFIKSIQENGFIGSWLNYRTGAPGISTLIDFPASSHLDAFLYWILSWFTDSTPRIIYLFLIISFVLDGLAMFYLLYKLKLNNMVNFVISSLFSFAPFHFYRYLAHNTLIIYISIPLAIYLGCYILGLIEEEQKWKIVLTTIIIGLGYGYYYAFALIIMTIAYLVHFIRSFNIKDLLKKLWIVGLLLFIIFLGLLPKMVYGWIYGANTEVVKRLFFEQETYGLKIIQMLLPVSYSRIETLRNLTAEYSSAAPLVNENALSSLGLVASAGFIILCVTFLISYTKKEKKAEKLWLLIDYIVLLTLVFVLMGAIGGFGEIFNWIVTPQIRCYNRASIVITCLALIMIAILLDFLKKKRGLIILGSAFVLLVGVFDQVRISEENWQAQIQHTQKMYEEYFARVENELEEGAMVYQLPYMELPEAGTLYNLNDYQLFAGFLFTDTLRWSYGSVRGRNEEARALYIDEGMSYAFLEKIKEAGFTAVYIDTDGYEDAASSILAFYNDLGIKPMISEDGKLYTYDISGIKIKDEWLEPGFEFCKKWNESYRMNVSEEKLGELAREIGEQKQDAYRKLFASIENTDIINTYTNEEYVEFLYTDILNRQASIEERVSWIECLNMGESRERVFCAFLSSPEFRINLGYDKVEE